MAKVIRFRRREPAVSLSILDEGELVRFDSIKRKSLPDLEMLCLLDLASPI
jgi:hypothetical protein